jgi:hypothetical protein
MPTANASGFEDMEESRRTIMRRQDIEPLARVEDSEKMQAPQKPRAAYSIRVRSILRGKA